RFFPLSFIAANSEGTATQQFLLTINFTNSHPAVAGSVAVATSTNVPVSIPANALVAAVGNLPPAPVLSAVDPSSTQGYGRIAWTNGIIIYAPRLGYFGYDSFEFTVTNSEGTAVGGVVNITI